MAKKSKKLQEEEEARKLFSAENPPDKAIVGYVQDDGTVKDGPKREMRDK